MAAPHSKPLSKPARSLLIFAIYLIATGLSFLVAPDSLLALLHLPALPAGWARVIGLLTLVIGIYDFISARAEVGAFIRASVYVRLGFAVGAALLVVVRQMPPALLLLGAVDAAGAGWTALELKRTRSTA